MLHPLAAPESSLSLSVRDKSTSSSAFVEVTSNTRAYVVFGSSVAPAGAVNVLSCWLLNEAGLVSTWRLPPGRPESVS